MCPHWRETCSLQALEGMIIIHIDCKSNTTTLEGKIDRLKSRMASLENEIAGLSGSMEQGFQVLRLVTDNLRK